MAVNSFIVCELWGFRLVVTQNDSMMKTTYMK